MGRILVVRIGAMGDIIHALPAVESLHRSFPQHSITWLVAPRWIPLLEGNPAIDRLLPFERHSVSQLCSTITRIRQLKPDIAFDFQGLLQSAIAGRLSRPVNFWGFTRTILREPLAAIFYTDRVNAVGPHRVERNLSMVAAAGAEEVTTHTWLPPGFPDGSLPEGPFVLASPYAGWTGKEWPLENYTALAKALSKERLLLVLNVPASKAAEVKSLSDVWIHSSSLAGLIHATRRATAVVGLDSGPMHLAAAVAKPGVAIFGPTDPVATGPFGASLTVLRAPGFESTYKRHRHVHASMHAVTVDQVYAALLASLERNGAQLGHRKLNTIEAGRTS